MDAAQFIDLVKREQAATALAALRSPRSRDSFEFGHASGVINGLERALEILDQTIEDADPRQQPVPETGRTSSNPYFDDLDAAPALPEQYSYNSYKPRGK